ncbi:GGDEF domain-containing protein [Thiospirochaeta perfilievii]|uniref:diguanylate cyclase n=1 Tax=Thiospirochaeta perfilievii TaxID=252967 RepID=A0A5C1QCZ6_9SPIO|nr:GGDEF domain-containing protein [Thiospirochaeta perfilievii]QEN05287.1 GGDEF domain-containing protein [Thiospirochaeta perfilievii]
MGEASIDVIKFKYRSIDRKWLNIHFFISLALVFSVLLLEITIGYIVYRSGEINSTIPRYLLKFLILPTLVNSLIVLLNYLILKSNKVPQYVKIYSTSILLLLICLIVFTVHSTFSALYFIFLLPILLTTIYGSYRLSTITSFLSIIGVILSELFIVWDLDKPSIFENGLRTSNFIIAIFILFFFYIMNLVVIYFERIRSRGELKKDFERHHLKKKIKVDELTGIYNRIAFRAAIDEMEEDKSLNSYIFVMLDIDNFKTLNDTFGHVVGDECLKELGSILEKCMFGSTAFRYGGDEFSIIFKNVKEGEVIDICNKINSMFSQYAKGFKCEKPITLSFGVAHYRKDISPSDLIVNSDLALYESKKTKNKITLFKDILSYQ